MCDYGIGETAAAVGAAGTASAAAGSAAAASAAATAAAAAQAAAIGQAIAIAGIAASTLSAGVGMYGAYQSQEASNNAAKYNAAVADGQATQAQQLGTVNAEQHDLQVKALIGEQTAGYAGGGVEVNSGSALTQTKQTAGYGALDSLSIKQQAANSATALQNQAQLDQAKMVNPYGTAGTSLLSSSSSVGNSFLAANKAGVF